MAGSPVLTMYAQPVAAIIQTASHIYDTQLYVGFDSRLVCGFVQANLTTQNLNFSCLHRLGKQICFHILILIWKLMNLNIAPSVSSIKN